MVNELAWAGIAIGSASAVGIASLTAAFSECISAGYAMEAIGRQPGANKLLTRSAIITMCVTETGAIFCLVIGLLLIFGGFVDGGIDYARAASLLAAGIAVGLGTMGANLGSGHTGAEACRGLGRSPSHSLPLTTNMLIGQAMTQTASVYAFVVAILLLYAVPPMAECQSVFNQVFRSCAYLGAAFSIGIGTFGSGVGSGLVTATSCKMMAKHLNEKSHWMRMTIITSAIAQTTAIYALVISFLLILM